MKSPIAIASNEVVVITSPLSVLPSLHNCERFVETTSSLSRLAPSDSHGRQAPSALASSDGVAAMSGSTVDHRVTKIRLSKDERAKDGPTSIIDNDYITFNGVRDESWDCQLSGKAVSIGSSIVTSSRK